MKLGKLPARLGAVKFTVANFASTLPTPPAKYGHYSLEGADWQMLGNDQYGDCVWAGAAHEHMLWNKEAGRVVAFNNTGVLAAYSDVTGFNPNDPNSDQGTDMQAAADYRRKTGVLDATGVRHQIGAYLAIEAQNVTQLKQAVSTFSSVGIGIQFPSSAMAQFEAGKSWSVVSGAQVEGGHYVPVVGYDTRYVYVVTWGKVQRMTWGFFKKYNDEAIAYVSQDMLANGKSIDGFDLPALQNALNQL